MTTVCSVTPTIPQRFGKKLQRAFASIQGQDRPVDQISIAVDAGGEGAGPTRQRALAAADTDWVAFLDDDDEWDLKHVGLLLRTAEETGADVVYPWYRVRGGRDPLAKFEGVPWDPENPHLFPICALVRTGIAQCCRFPEAGEKQNGGDWVFWQQVFATGAKVIHLPTRTWTWHHHGQNSSGRPTHGDARL